MLVVSAAALLSGCGAPAWVKKGSTAFTPSEKIFYGVGKADAGIKSEDLRREAADNRARADLQLYFDGFNGYMMKQYEGAGGQYVERAIKTVGAGRLSGVRIVERYRNGGAFYSLARLDLDESRRLAKNAPELTAQARKYIQEKSETFLGRMREEEMKTGRSLP